MRTPIMQNIVFGGDTERDIHFWREVWFYDQGYGLTDSWNISLVSGCFGIVEGNMPKWWTYSRLSKDT